MNVAMKIVHSWLSLKTWIKVWLIWLNLVLWGALLFLHDPLGLWTLVSLPVTFVFLMWIAVRQGGLVRLLGVGHLIPWIPLLTYLELRLFGEGVGPQIIFTADSWLFIWAVTLWATLAVCLAFDAYNVVRWFRGERFVLGTRAAADAGASKLAPKLG